MRFDFANSARILFAPGAVSELPAAVREFGGRALLVTGRDASRAAPLVKGLHAADVHTILFAVEGEPTVDAIRNGAHVARKERRNVVVGFGGGSAVDAAKAIAILATNSGEPLDYLEIIGKGQPFENAPLPCLAVPTTAGTGAEVTRNAVLGSPQHRLKASLRSPLMLPRAAIVDPALTLSLPPEITASTGLDALTQLLEPYVSCRANGLADLFCVEGMKRVKIALERAFADGSDRDARESMSFASLLGGLALANAGLGVVHGFAAPLGGMLAAPHGALCAAVLPHAVQVNVNALRQRAASNPALAKYAEAARLLTGRAHAEAGDLAPWLAELVQRLQITPLSRHGLTPDQIPALVEKAAQASSTKANPLPLTTEELTQVAERAL